MGSITAMSTICGDYPTVYVTAFPTSTLAHAHFCQYRMTSRGQINNTDLYKVKSSQWLWEAQCGKN